MRLLVLVLSSIFSVAHAQSDNVSSMQKIKILSWNIYMLPGFLGYGKIQRAEAIGQLLATGEYDVIVFQEAFHQRARKIISWHLQPAYSFQAGPANSHFLSLRANSGIWIFSRHPIVNTTAIEFETREGVDALSRKGGLLVELNVNGQTIQIIGTHLQNSGDSWLKQGQCVELFHKLMMQNQRAGVPQVVCGDFNIDPYSAPERYQQMLQTLNVTNEMITDTFTYDRLENDLKVEAGEKRELLDFILTRSNEGILECEPRKVKRYRQQWHVNHQDLSDHYSVETEVSFLNPVHQVLVSVK